ncbi:hypothetical protein [Halostella pelagica]|uniref:hypothetical protein n=1 Tax=Halostella pelagica TaxID=2583824 RepID=UPI0010822FCF|nr:hypothetical protein [Halostella pelagica]
MSIIISPKDFVETYSPNTDVGPWELLQQYYQATKASAELRGGNGGRAGSQRIATHLDLPRARLRAWIDDGGKPDPQHGLERAHAGGWIEVDTGSSTFEGLNRLVAQVFSGGTILTDTYRPYFAVDSDDALDRVVASCGLVGVEYDIYHADEIGRATEIRVTTDGAILGRVLTVLGAPLGEKATRDDLSLPNYLDNVGQHLRLDFARTYVLNRGAIHEDKATVTISEDRPQEYRDQVAAFLEETLGQTVTSGDATITLSADAARVLQ